MTTRAWAQPVGESLAGPGSGAGSMRAGACRRLRGFDTPPAAGTPPGPPSPSSPRLVQARFPPAVHHAVGTAQPGMPHVLQGACSRGGKGRVQAGGAPHASIARGAVCVVFGGEGRQRGGAGPLPPACSHARSQPSSRVHVAMLVTCPAAPRCWFPVIRSLPGHGGVPPLSPTLRTPLARCGAPNPLH